MLGWYSKLQRSRRSAVRADVHVLADQRRRRRRELPDRRARRRQDAGQRHPRALHAGRLRLADPADRRRERANAAHYKIKGYTTLFVGSDQAGSRRSIKQALATNHPVAIEMAVRHGFDYLGANPAAVDDDITTAIRGYHEVLAVGYDAAGLIIENSWGTGWANGGFGRLSWRVVQNDVCEADIIDGFVPPPPPPPAGPIVTPPAKRWSRSAPRRSPERDGP